jgi:excisionase family DNA binding protein
MLHEHEEMLTAKEAARALKVTDARIRQLLLEGKIKGHKISNLVWLIPKSEIARYTRERRPPGRPAQINP